MSTRATIWVFVGIGVFAVLVTLAAWGRNDGKHCTQYSYVAKGVTTCTQWTLNGH